MKFKNKEVYVYVYVEKHKKKKRYEQHPQWLTVKHHSSMKKQLQTQKTKKKVSQRGATRTEKTVFFSDSMKRKKYVTRMTTNTKLKKSIGEHFGW